MGTLKLNNVTAMTESGGTVTLDSGVIGGTFAASTDTTVSASNPVVSSNPSAIGHLWINTTSGEFYVCTDATIGANVWKNTKGTGNIGSPTTSYTISWLVIGGGGSGGGYYRSGGGGAGGYRNSYLSEKSGDWSLSETAWTVTPSTSGDITVIVGAGGAMAQGATYGQGADGSLSSITATGQTTVSSAGGGGAGDYKGTGRPGGSGGGAGHESSAAHTGGAGTSNQGGDGGDTPSNTTAMGAPGGGAAGDADDGATENQSYAGQGLFSAITGFNIQRAGGGGAGGYAPSGISFGGEGGGGDGGNDASEGYQFKYSQSGSMTAYWQPTNGVDYTGSGGGGNPGDLATTSVPPTNNWGGSSPSSNSPRFGSGGIGTVILRMPTINYSGATTGYPIITQSGTDTVVQFIGNGTYTT